MREMAGLARRHVEGAIKEEELRDEMVTLGIQRARETIFETLAAHAVGLMAVGLIASGLVSVGAGAIATGNCDLANYPCDPSGTTIGLAVGAMLLSGLAAAVFGAAGVMAWRTGKAACVDQAKQTVKVAAAGLGMVALTAAWIGTWILAGADFNPWE